MTAQDKLSGTASVSPTGAAVYSIPIETLKGIGDLKPSIGIAYNSQMGNGLVGWGCNITGLSSITRGMKDWAHDNTVKGIDYSSNSCALYLDGKRLLLKSGTEGTDGCVYSPEGEPQTTVTLHSSLSSTSSWFEVDTGDGMVYEYGHSGAVQTLSNPTTVSAWYIKNATNPLGHSIIYNYETQHLCLYPTVIVYGGNSRIVFGYENRNDTIPIVMGNNSGYVSRRLKTISVQTANDTYRTYTMTYAYDGNTESVFSKLQSVTEMGEDGYSTHVLSSNWNNLPSYSISCLDTNLEYPSSSSAINYTGEYYIAGDLNNDGVSDFVRVASGTKLLQGSRVPHFFAHIIPSKVQDGEIGHEQLITIDYQTSDFTSPWPYQYGSIVITDMDGDGKNDLIIPKTNNPGEGQNFYFMRISGSDIISGNGYPGSIGLHLIAGTEMPLYAFADLNNNGKTDVVILEKQAYNGKYYFHWKEFTNYNNNVFHNIGLTLTTAPKHFFTSDFNHDGLIDIMVVCSDGCRIFYNQGGSSLQNAFVDSSTLNTGLTNHDRLEMGDFNGDGIADFIWNDDNSGNLYFEIGSANGTYSRHLAYSLGYGVFSKNTDEGTWCCMIVDLDHDGKSDVVLSVAKYILQNIPICFVYDSTHSYWLLSNGTTLTKKKESSSTRPDDAKPGHWFVGDFRGQGFLEVANYGHDCYNGSNVNMDPTVNVYSCSSQNISNGKVASFTDSHGRSTAFTYASMTSDLVYTKGTSEQYPLLDVAAPLCVTSQVSETGGSPISTQTNYTYAGLRAHLTGRGLLGFKEMTASEAYTGKVTKNVVDTLNVNYYVPKNITTTTIQGGKTSSVSQNMTIRTYNYGNHTNYALFPTIQTDTDIYGNVSWTTRNYDMDKGILLIENKIDDGGDFYCKTTYTYGQAKVAGAWRPISILQEQKHPDDTNKFEKQTNISYNSYGLKSTVVEYSNTSKPLTTAYQYDVNGNVTSETLSGNGIGNDAVTYYQYSNNGKFLTQKSTAAGTIGYTYNVFGEMTAETDLTDSSHPLTTYYYRDGFGLLTMEDKPTGERTEWEQATTSVNGGAYYVVSHKYGSPEVTTVYDTFGNEMSTETEGIGGVAISTFNSYNNFGKLSQQERTHGDLTIFDSYSYDNLGRLLSFSSTDGTEIDYEYYDRMIVTTENGKEFTKYYDAWGNITESADPLSSVSYTYSSNGKPSAVECENNTISILYDSKGNQISLNDPDAGTTTYGYDALNRLTQQTDARGYVTSFTYDGAGRITQKTVGGSTTSYTYGTSGGAAGQLVEEQNANGSISYTYDSSGRLSQETRTFDLQELTFGYSYDSYGRLSRRTYPQNVNVDYAYNDDYLVATAINGRNIGYLKLDNGLTTVRTYGGRLINRAEPILIDDPIFPNLGGTAQPMDWPQLPITDSTDVDPGLIYYPDSLVNQPDPWGQALTDYYYVQDGLGTKSATYDSRGYLTSLGMHRGQSTLRQMTFDFEDGTGNLLSRTGMGSQTEDFTYDDLDRLTNVSGSNYHSFTYDLNGNLDYKSGAGYLSYGATHLHAVVGATNEGAVSATPQTITYSPFGKILSIIEGNYSMDFTYGPDEERWKTVLWQGNSVLRTTIYGDNYEQVTDAYGQTRHFYYLDGAVYVLDDGATSGNLYFAFTDHLGSITRLYNESGSLVFDAGYDAWGQQTVNTNTIDFRRGYTGHEMMPEFNLINMNGRLYDPALGRFLSPDNYVQLPDFSQSFNRYSYCLNNPLKYTDPDGELFGIDDAFWIGLCITGAINVWANWDEIQHNWGHAVASFFIGAGSTTLGIVNPLLGAAALGVSNSIINQSYNGSVDWGQVGFSMSMSLLTQGIGQKVGSIIDASVSQLTSKVKNIVVEKWLNGAIDGTLGGFTMGTLFSLGNGENIGTSLENGGKNALQGFVIGGMNGLYQGYVESRNQIKSTIPLRQDVKQKFQKHAFSNGRLDDLGLNREEITERTIQLVEKHSNLLHDGQNNISLKIQNKPMILRVHVIDGTVFSINLMPNKSKSGYIRSSTPIIFLPNQKW
ncbi:MAG: FG-GAP-like repeat-containing protein [Prevotella sp.]|nr:FG-GAP-like repeat-containing protein [Prevotella sp.]